MKKFFNLLFISLILLAPFFVARSQAPAEGLTISPPILEINLEPGKTYEENIHLTNPTQNLIELYPQVMNFTSSGETGEPAFLPPTSEGNKFSLANWIKFDKNKIALMPDQVAEWPYQIMVPDEVEPGGHYGVVFFASQPPKLEENTTQVAIGSMVGSLILGRTPGDINENANLVDFSAKKFYLKSPVDFTIRIKNLGNVHFKPKGEITIKNLFGAKAGTVTVNEAKGNVLPESTRKFTEKWTFSKWAVGRYTASLAVSYGETNQILSDKLSFWIIPIWFIILLAIIIFAIIVLIIRRIRKKKNQPKAGPPRAEKQPERKKVILR